MEEIIKTYDDLKKQLKESGHEYDMALIEKAYHFAEESHGDQKRLSGAPYMSHPVAVACILAELGMDSESVAAAALLILDEPINGLDTDGMRIMREILVDITKNYGCTVLISSHILGELEKIATHYGIIRQGKMIQELSAQEMESRARVFVSLKTKDMQGAKTILRDKFDKVKEEDGYLRVYDVDDPRLPVPEAFYSNVFTAALGFPYPGFSSSDYFPLLPWCFVFIGGTVLGRLARENKQ